MEVWPDFYRVGHSLPACKYFDEVDYETLAKDLGKISGIALDTAQAWKKNTMIHELKTWPNQFALVKSGQQKCQVRNCFDRDFAVRDTLILRKYDPNASYTGHSKGAYITKTGHTCLKASEADTLLVSVTHIMPSGSVLLETHTCVMSVELVPQNQTVEQIATY